MTWRGPAYTPGWEKRTLSSFRGQGLFQTLCVGIGLSLGLGWTWPLLCVTLGLDRACAEDGQSLQPPGESPGNLGRGRLRVASSLTGGWNEDGRINTSTLGKIMPGGGQAQRECGRQNSGQGGLGPAWRSPKLSAAPESKLGPVT